ncbi:hypothetical protein AMK26_22830 [Streptomyces sp. CB03234]|uniref:FG-GAP-like repeat-containing protein n=1 Tax=Streptomyces sp. (strain CB03234) TaxID=1703937 RepID=UPI000939917D|nr:FG-GAP-like repeat-containing protein [Streptomyces sp. CB03234]OKK02909.1 hypothetical protein AMK26_22830 [Streptomyces sp. CB03234]
MSSRTLGRTALGVALSATLMAGIAPPAAAADPVLPGSLVIPAERRVDPGASQLVGAGTDGFLRRASGGGHVWTSYADGSVTPVPSGQESVYGTGTNVVAFVTYATTTGTRVRLRDMVTRAEQTVVIPRGQSFVTAMGTTVVTREMNGSTVVAWHLLTAADGGTTDRVVTGFPAGAKLPTTAFASNGRGAIVTYTLDTKPYVVWIDHSGEARPTHLEDHKAGAGRAVLSGDRFAYWTSAGKVVVWDVADFTRPHTTLDLAYDTAARPLGVVGDSFLTATGGTGQTSPEPVHQIWATPMDGGPRQLLLDRATAAPPAGPDGRILLVRAGEGMERSVHALERGEDGALRAAKVADIPTVPEVPLVVSAAQGQLATYEAPYGASGQVRSIDLSAGVPPTAGPRTDRGTGPRFTGCSGTGCAELLPTGDGRLVYRSVSPDRSVIHLVGPGESVPGKEIVLGRSMEGNASSMEVSGRYAAYYSTSYDSPDDLRLQVMNLDTGKPALDRPGDPGEAFALWGSTLWVEEMTSGVVKATDIRTGKQITSVDLGDCDLTDLQAVGTRLYWACHTTQTAGVFDTATKRNLKVPSTGGDMAARLADGYLGTVDGTTVSMIDVRGTSASGRVVGRTHGIPYAGYGWTVDRFGGHLTRVGEDGALHVVPAGAPASALSVIDTDVPGLGNVATGTRSWTARWWLSKPAASWRVTLKNRATGTTVRTLTGGLARGLVTATWDGRNVAGELVPNGAYTWTAEVRPADGQGAALVRSGTMTLTGGTAVRRDHAGSAGAPDGVGDLLTLSTSGALAFRHGTGTGSLSGATTGSGWSTSAVAVPFGGLDGDRCNDVLVRLGGELRAYRPGCGKPLVPTVPYTSLGTVWAQFDVLTSPGDLTGDGRADLVARQSSTGDMYLYADDGAGKLKARGRIGTNWKPYRAVFGAGDINGDGLGDLLAVDSANTLWRYDGTASGTVKPRAAVFAANWATGRNAFAGAGDITGDGKPDLLSRNAAGDLLRNSGNGTGSFGSTTKIGTGWQGYKGLF